MKEVDLSPEMVEAIIDMQQNADGVVSMIDMATDFIIDYTDENDKELSKEAFLNIKALRFVRQIAIKFLVQTTRR